MSTRDRKRELKASFKAQERAILEASMPLENTTVHALFTHLDRAPGCDHTLRETMQFLRNRNIDAKLIIPWLHQHGGFCDCEVLWNVANAYGPIVGYEV